MTIYPKQTAPVVAWKKDWNGIWTTVNDMEVMNVHRCCASSGDDTAVIRLRYGIIVDSSGTRVVQPITTIAPNSYVRIQQGRGRNALFIGVVVEVEDHVGATMSHNGSSVLTGDQYFKCVGASEILRRRPIWKSLWLPRGKTFLPMGNNNDEQGTDEFRVDWIPPYNGECRNYIGEAQESPFWSYQTYMSYTSNMTYDSANNLTLAGFGGSKALTIEQFIVYFNKLLEPTENAALPTFTIRWSSDCNNTKTQTPIDLDNPVVDNAYDVFTKLINPQSSGLDYYFTYGDTIYIDIFPAFALGVDNNTDTSQLDLESPLIEDSPTITQGFRKYRKYRFVGERIIFVDLLRGAYHNTDYSTNIVPLKTVTDGTALNSDESADSYGFGKFGIGDRLNFNWDKFQPSVSLAANGQCSIDANTPFPKQTLYLKTLDYVYDKSGKKHSGPIVTIGGAEYLRRNGGAQYNFTDIDDDNVSENNTYIPVGIRDVEMDAEPLPDTIGVAIRPDGEYRRLYAGRDSDQFNRKGDVSSDITDIKEAVSDIDKVDENWLKHGWSDLCYDTMTVTLAWESDQRTQVVYGDNNAPEEQVIHVPGARLVIIRGYYDVGHDSNSPSVNVGEGDSPVFILQDFKKFAQTMNNIATAAQNNRYQVSVSVRDVLSTGLLGSVIQLQRGGVQTTTDCIVKSLDYSFPENGSAVTRVN